MPNWCDNAGTITGDPAKIDFIEKTMFSFSMILPPYEQFPGVPLKESGSGGGFSVYSGLSGRWGTKWEGDAMALTRDSDNSLFFSFMSAWGPPIGIYDELVNTWGLEVSAGYIEAGADFAGIYVDGVDNCVGLSDAVAAKEPCDVLCELESIFGIDNWKEYSGIEDEEEEEVKQEVGV